MDDGVAFYLRMNNLAEVRGESPAEPPEELPAETPEKPAESPAELPELPAELPAEAYEEMPPLIRYNPHTSVAVAHSSAKEGERNTAAEAEKEEAKVGDTAESDNGTKVSISDLVLAESQYV